VAQFLSLIPICRGYTLEQMATHHYRAHQRFVVQLPMTVTSLRRSVRARGHSVDLGLGGAACVLDTPLRLAEAVQVVLTSDVPHVLSAEVAWVGWAESSVVRVGLRFKSEDAEQWASILSALGVSNAQVGT
jgi:hypothetical protein